MAWIPAVDTQGAAADPYVIGRGGGKGEAGRGGRSSRIFLFLYLVFFTPLFVGLYYLCMGFIIFTSYSFQASFSMTAFAIQCVLEDAYPPAGTFLHQ